MADNLTDWEVAHFLNGTMVKQTTSIAVEHPITIIVNGKEFAKLVCSPEYAKELVVGFLASEGIIYRYQAIQSLNMDEEAGFAYVEIDKLPDGYDQDYSKRFISSCCGKSRQFYLGNDAKTTRTVMSKLTISASNCLYLMEQLQQASDQVRQTGDVHNAALAKTRGLQLIRTDIGRHNALDKLFGSVLINHIPVQDKIIAFSGRVSSEVLLKTAKMRIPILISKSAPTNLALRLADELGITVIGFARKNRLNVYTHPSRIKELAYAKNPD